ncbi:ubiquitin-activating enzyme E1, putative [Theileria annulata]|uniref:E1 ubiquitin-activating enzyme n=1 Tax=Theileria annulata TaxID=5874 RepID=Q4UF46_THEAN|nr:ubiquitin-activating enzyme E1, putative [Theileria annulata]CAI74293.1 ubiquitin-activating enzyme E1, putative [Theileria annulata]|eukprot:XP_952025.1 ubiquitin-activating enzyme E1, putative [Theileria annulata]
MSFEEKIDTNLYSRQIGTFGFDMMGKLQKLNVLIIGMKSTGIEIAKNLALMGVESIKILDNDVVQRRDLGVNYFVRASSVGKESIASACLHNLKDLNRNVDIKVINNVNEELVVGNDVVVCCDQNVEVLKNLNRICRANSLGKRIGFIACDTFGMIGSVFVDFGDNFISFDPTGTELKTGIIESITNDKEGLVTLITDGVIDFQTGDYVRFSEIEGMTELNNKEPVQIKVNSKNSFLIGDLSHYTPHTSGGLVTEVRYPKRIEFRSYEDCVLNPSSTGCLYTIDYSLVNRAEQLHWITMGYKHGSGDPKSTLTNAQMMNSNAKSCGVESVDEELFKSFFSQVNFKVPPLASFIGGIVAHEVIKFTGKYHPINQWLYVDFSLPKEMLSGDFSGRGFDERYFDQVSLWGSDLQNKLQNSKIFIVGAGALGCEFLKNFALLGCGSQQEGLLTITDNDRIEVSNISRQFLFRTRHVGLSKSSVACESALEINPSIKVKPLEIRVGEETEDIFDEHFWSSLNVVVNALDNIQARQYVDGICVWYEKPLVESGTLGTLGNVQVVVPHMTQSYSESQDPPETSIPLCTLKHFPYQVEHTIEWARDVFEGLFTQIPLDIKKIRQNDEVNSSNIDVGVTEIPYERLELISKLLNCTPKNAKEQLLRISSELYNLHFVNNIQQLLNSFPKDHVLSDGQKFWSPPKRPPTPLTFDLSDKIVQLFILSTTKIFASMMNLDLDVVESDILSLRGLRLPEFQPRVLKLSQDKLNVEVQSDTSADSNPLLNEITNSNRTLNAVEFEKDDESNYHIEFIWSASVLRCRNYAIKECNKMKAKLISGKIIPAIATTTAMIGGLVTIEFLKALCYRSLKISHFRNAFACLATPIWLQSEPLPPIPTKDKDYDPVTCGPVRALPPNFTVWNKLIVLIPNGTVKQLIDWIRSKFNIEVIILSAGNLCIYNSFLPQHRNERLNAVITELVERLGKKKIGVRCSHLVIDASCTDSDDVDVVIPTIKFQFR